MDVMSVFEDNCRKMSLLNCPITEDLKKKNSYMMVWTNNFQVNNKSFVEETKQRCTLIKDYFLCTYFSCVSNLVLAFLFT